jgi:hypothetical protein
MIIVGMPSAPANSCSLISFETQKYYGSLMGAETQEMLDYC